MHELRSLDLFTGIGGFALALKGICRPVAMCDLDPDAREVLRCRMTERRLETCPVFDDVTALKANDLPLAVDVIVGGWPCQDLSAVGLRRGLGGARSGLVREVFRLMDETGAQGALLENVPRLLAPGNGFHEVLNAFVLERGFDVSWCVLSAGAVGAPHVRRRLYLWVRKPSFEHEWAEGSLHHEPFDWGKDKEPARMVCSDDTVVNHRNKRQMLLGNAVVPDALRSAFFVLASGFRKAARPDGKGLRIESPCENMLKEFPFESLTDKKFEVPRWGHARARNGAVQVLAFAMPKLLAPDLGLVLDPAAFFYDGPLQAPRNGMERSPPVTEPMTLHSWSTPRSITCAARLLSERVSRDLPTQVRFEKSTPNELRDGQINTGFVEYLMGYPANWTKLPSHWKTTAPVGYRPGQIAKKKLKKDAEDAARLARAKPEDAARLARAKPETEEDEAEADAENEEDE